MEKWFLHCKKADFLTISKELNISPMLARVLRNRGLVTVDEMRAFLNNGIKDMYDPFLMKDMSLGIDYVLSAINRHLKIRVIGDYDVDGLCASYILDQTLQFAGADVDVRLPDRVLDGYGMNEKMAIEAKENGVSLILTCDNGVSSIDAVKKARELGMTVVVTDHHELPAVFPEANAIINPKRPDCSYPYKEICGAAVAYKFAQALIKSIPFDKREGADELLEKLMQFAGMATIADIVPLHDENRIFAKEGLHQLRKTDNIGLKALMDVRNIQPEKLKSYHVGFVLSPCINSAGRLKHAKFAYELLNEKDPEKALQIATELSELNEERKMLTITQYDVAKSILEKMSAEHGLDKVLVIYLPDAHESVAGIIAGKIKDEYNRPTLLITNSEEGYKGSGRSIDAYNMFEEFSKYPEFFKKCGGHAKASGFTLNCTPNELAEVLNRDCTLTDTDLDKKIWIDMQLPFRYVTEEFADELDILEPYGMLNEKPVFAEKDVSVLSYKVVGNSHKLITFDLKDNTGYMIKGVYFGNDQVVYNCNDMLNSAYEKYGDDLRLSLLFSPGINEFRGDRIPQVVIQHIKIDNE